MDTILQQRINARRSGIPEGQSARMNLLEDPFDAQEAIATLGIDFSRPSRIEPIGDGVRKYFATNQEGVTFLTTSWTRTPTEVELEISNPSFRK